MQLVLYRSISCTTYEMIQTGGSFGFAEKKVPVREQGPASLTAGPIEKTDESRRHVPNV
jgi:hypothetical protein